MILNIDQLFSALIFVANKIIKTLITQVIKVVDTFLFLTATIFLFNEEPKFEA